jgi:hypothetical protein
MSSLRTVRRAAAPRHATPAPRVTYQRRLLLSRAGTVAKNITLLALVVVVLFAAVLGLLAAASWASDRQSGVATGRAF